MGPRITKQAKRAGKLLPRKAETLLEEDIEIKHDARTNESNWDRAERYYNLMMSHLNAPPGAPNHVPFIQASAESRLAWATLAAYMMDELAGHHPEGVPIPMLLWCPECGARHIDVELKDKVHHTHACQHCGMVWRPARHPTVGVAFLPGFKDA